MWIQQPPIGLVLPHLYDPAPSGGNSGQDKSPTSSVQWQGTPIAPALAIPEREGSLRVKRASPPRIEEDYDQYRNMLAKSATSSQKGSRDIFHDASEESQAPMSRTDQQKASREYGRRQIHATDGNHLNMQSLSVADSGSGIGRASTKPTPMKEPNSNTRSSTEPVANKQDVTTRKAETISSQDHTLRHRPSDMNLQDHQISPTTTTTRTQNPLPSRPSPN